MRALFHSIRWQVQLWYGLILLLTLVALCLTAYRLAWDHQLRRLDRELLTMERHLMRALFRAAGTEEEGKPENFIPAMPGEVVTRLQQGTLTLPQEVWQRYENDGAGRGFFLFEDRDGRPLLASRHLPAGLEPLPVPEKGVAEIVRNHGSERLFLRSSSHGLRGVIGRDMTPELEGMRRFAWSLGGVGLGVWLFGLVGGWWLAGRAIRPIRVISATASRIAQGKTQERIALTQPGNELDELSRVLNDTFERLHAALERQKEFTADASHELRTPVTILLSETQRILKRERTPEEYREGLETCRLAAMRMRGLIEALLILARHENPQAAAQAREEVDLGTVLAETLEHLAPLAREAGVTLRADLAIPAHCLGAPQALGLIASNLITNAIEHGGSGAEVEVRTVQRGDRIGWSVSDNGPGIEPEALPHLFERFYRADKARTGSLHTGLGLSMVKTLVESHGGEVHVESRPGEGARFEVLLPAL